MIYSKLFAKSSLLVLLWQLAGCAVPPIATPENNTPNSQVAEPQNPAVQLVCVTKVYLSEISRAHRLSGQTGGADFAIPVGECLNQQVKATFWEDSAVKASSRPQPAVNVGFAVGNGVRPAKRNGEVEVQVALQYQILRPTGQSYDNVAVGRATGKPEQAVKDALSQALYRFETALINAGICRVIQ
jgi:hypothetical protein